MSEERSAGSSDGSRDSVEVRRDHAGPNGTQVEAVVAGDEQSPPRNPQLETNGVSHLSLPPVSIASHSPSPALVITDVSSLDSIRTVPAVLYETKHLESSESNSNIDPHNEANGHLLEGSSQPIKTLLPPNELHDIPEESTKIRRKSSVNGDEKIFKLTPSEIQELTASPESLPQATPKVEQHSIAFADDRTPFNSEVSTSRPDLPSRSISRKPVGTEPNFKPNGTKGSPFPSIEGIEAGHSHRRPGPSRTLTSQTSAGIRIAAHPRSSSFQSAPLPKPISSGSRPEPLDFDLVTRRSQSTSLNKSPIPDLPTSPLPQHIPVPPMSIPTYLQLELADSKPSPLYIYRPTPADRPYESSKIKFERLLNFLLLPPQLEQVLYFGTLACLDAWLYTFTILPLRFCKAAFILIKWWVQVALTEARFIADFIHHGAKRMWSRRKASSTRSGSLSQKDRPVRSATSSFQSQAGPRPDMSEGRHSIELRRRPSVKKARSCWSQTHRRTKSQPSSLSSKNKADLLQGLVIIASCIVLMELDASRMYHNIKAQSNIKLYVIYNGLEVCARYTLLVTSLTYHRSAINFFQHSGKTSASASFQMRFWSGISKAEAESCDH